MVMFEGEMPAAGLRAEVDVVDQPDACQFVERAVSGRWVDRSGSGFDCFGQDLLNRQKSFAMAGQDRANGTSRERQPKPSASDPLVEEGLDSCSVLSRHRRRR